MRKRVPESPVPAPGQSHSLSACDTSHTEPGAFAGVYVEVAEYGDGVYLPGDVVDDRLISWWYDGGALRCRPSRPRLAFPESSGPVVGAGPAQPSGGVR